MFYHFMQNYPSKNTFKTLNFLSLKGVVILNLEYRGGKFSTGVHLSDLLLLSGVQNSQERVLCGKNILLCKKFYHFINRQLKLKLMVFLSTRHTLRTSFQILFVYNYQK